MRVILLLVLTIAAAGCTTAPVSVSPDDVSALAGSWQGWLVTDGGVSPIRFDIRADGTFQVSGPLVRASGILVVVDGALRFDGTGMWRGALVPEGTAERRVLRIQRDDRLYRGTLHPISPGGVHPG
ncbi:MAG TPA: hypothetical protein VID28_18415 [Methylomirabilota bacterium]|jgi:hypothetical protein